jgi:hypothetical protein
MSMPGVQIPHWAAPWARESRLQGRSGRRSDRQAPRRSGSWSRRPGPAGTRHARPGGRRAGPCTRRSRPPRTRPSCRSARGRRAGRPTAAASARRRATGAR